MLKVVVLVGGAFSRGRALSNKITALKNGDPAELPLQLCVNEEDPHQAGPAGSFTLDVPASRTVRNECVVYEQPGLWYSVLAAQTN